MDCNVCDHVDDFMVEFNYVHFSKSGQAGCRRCAFLTGCLDLAIPDVESIAYIKTIGDTGLMIVIEGEDNIFLDIFTSCGHEKNPFQTGDSTRKVLKHLPGRTDSTESVKSMQIWLKECEETHERCSNQHNRKPPQFNYAKRFLHLKGRSIALQEDISVERYACLSHCWGITSKPVQTTAGNLASHRVEVPWKDLSATFQDAVDICNALDIPYLWIDSLCIIQDSIDDWNCEAPKMADIYENACVTIAATKSSDGTKGCFSSTAVEHMSKPIPGYKDTYVRQSLPNFPQLSIDSETMDWPLFNRAWIYQEMRLSRRVLHFCAQEVIWVCRTSQQSEGGENDKDLDHYIFDGNEDESHLPYHNRVPYACLEANPTRLWHRMIMEYSRLQLSVKGDKMAALAGLAQRMARMRSGDRYLAGSWEKSLLLDLLWERDIQSTSSTPKLDRYPSWSWPSFDGQVSWSAEFDRTLKSVRIENIDYPDGAQDFMCKATNIALTLRAPLLDARTFFARPSDYENDISQSVTNLDHLYVAYTMPDTEVHESDADSTGSDGDSPDFDAESTHTEQSGFIVPISAESQMGEYFMAIHVRRKPGSDYFERIGSVTLAHPAAALLDQYKAKLKDQERRKMHMVSVRTLLESLPTSSIILV